jgi:hypothetical protein
MSLDKPERPSAGHNGYAEELLADGSVYHGNFLNGIREGAGRLTRPDGVRYEGSFVNGVPHGKGILCQPDGKMFSGIWTHGKAGKLDRINKDTDGSDPAAQSGAPHPLHEAPAPAPAHETTKPAHASFAIHRQRLSPILPTIGALMLFAGGLGYALALFGNTPMRNETPVVPIALNSPDADLPLELQTSILLRDIERAHARGDHARVAQRITELRDLSATMAAGDLLFFEAEAYLELGNRERAKETLTLFLSIFGNQSELHDAAVALAARL